MTSRGYNGSGTVFFQNLDLNNQPVGGWYEVGVAYPFSITVSTDIARLVDRRVGKVGQVAETLASRGADGVAGAITLHQRSDETFAMMLAGHMGLGTEAAGKIDADFELPPAGQFIDVGRKFLSNVTVTSGGSPERADAGGYTVNAPLGLIGATANGPMAEGGPVRITADYAAQTGAAVIKIAAALQKKVAVKSHIRNEVSGQEYVVDLYQVTITTGGDSNLISADGQTFEETALTLSIETPDGMGYPGTVNGKPL